MFWCKAISPNTDLLSDLPTHLNFLSSQMPCPVFSLGSTIPPPEQMRRSYKSLKLSQKNCPVVTAFGQSHLKQKQGNKSFFTSPRREQVINSFCLRPEAHTWQPVDITERGGSDDPLKCRTPICNLDYSLG